MSQYFNSSYEPSEGKNDRNFNQCLSFVKNTFPEESEDIQYLQAKAVYAISEVFFGKIIPSVLNQTIRFSDN